MSRGFAVILLIMYHVRPLIVFVLILAEATLSYVCSRIYLHDPPGDEYDAFMPYPEIPAEALRKEQELAEADPNVNP